MLKRNLHIRNGFRLLLISLLPLTYSVAQANEFSITPNINNFDLKQPAISIIIDDMGYRLKSGSRAVNLPGAIAYSFLPHSPHVTSLSQLAHQQNKEVMLHLPMEAESGKSWALVA